MIELVKVMVKVSIYGVVLPFEHTTYNWKLRSYLVSLATFRYFID